MKKLIWPQPLNIGDKVALTAPSSPVNQKSLKNAINSIKFLGLKPVVMPSCHMEHGYMAGPDKQRADDLNHAFRNNDIKGIFCLRGGYGAMRILPLLDTESIKQNPKVFVGYSDITAIHTLINNMCGFITFHGPMPNISYEKLDTFTLNSLKSYIFRDKYNSTERKTLTIQNPENYDTKILIPGTVKGILTGGNLSMLMGTLGSPYEIDTHNKILFIEEVGERPYRLDKAFTALSLAGKFRDCAGIILGTFTDCDEPEHNNVPKETLISNTSLNVADIVKEVVLPWNKPTLQNLQVGHSYPQSTLPMGAQLQLNFSDVQRSNISVL